MTKNDMGKMLDKMLGVITEGESKLKKQLIEKEGCFQLSEKIGQLKMQSQDGVFVRRLYDKE